MARMLGRYRQGGCRPCTEPGPDCAGHERDTRRRKRAEQRAFQQEVNGMEPDDFHEDDEPIEKIEAFRRRMGWPINWVSSNGNDFNYDFSVSFTPEQIASGQTFYNYQPGARVIDEMKR